MRVGHVWIGSAWQGAAASSRRRAALGSRRPTARGMPAVGELVRSTSGQRMVKPPLRCPRGHPLRPGRMLVGTVACSCGRHLTWRCECGAVTYGPAPGHRVQRAARAGAGARLAAIGADASTAGRTSCQSQTALTTSKWSLRSLDPHAVKVVSIALEKSTQRSFVVDVRAWADEHPRYGRRVKPQFEVWNQTNAFSKVKFLSRSACIPRYSDTPFQFIFERFVFHSRKCRKDKANGVKQAARARK